jgi:4-amino-4-deoxy-L-arabinose transferase-like glycosyltransferase
VAATRVIPNWALAVAAVRVIPNGALAVAARRGIPKGAPATFGPRRDTFGRSASDRASSVALAAALIAYLALAFGYLTLTPPWQNPDEPAHFNYVAFVATTGGLPVLQPGDWDSALLERLKNGTLQPQDDITKIRYESWQPPLFYLVAAPLYRTASQAPEALTRLRALNVVFGAMTLVVAYLVAREALPDPLPGAAPLAIVGIPMFTAVSAAVSADPLANLLAAAILLALVIRLRQPPDTAVGWPILTGALLGLGLLTKLELAIFGPLILAVILLRSARKLRETLLASLSGAILLIPWLIHQLASYGWTDPLAIARHSAVVEDQQRFTGFSLDWLAQFATTSFHSFWAQFGWMAIVASPRLYLIWGAITLIAVIGLVASYKQWLEQPIALLLLATIALAGLAYVGYNLAFVQFQARYLFTALVPIAILLVRGWSALPPRPWLAFILPAVLVGLNAYALLRVLVPGFAPGA